MLRTVVLLIVSTLAASAQSWNAVQALQPGDSVKIEDTNRAEHKGNITAVTADAVTLRAGKAEMSIARTSVRRVQIKASSRRLRNLAIGAAAGLAVGLIADNTIGTYLRNESNVVSRPVYYIVPIGLFGGIGAAIAPYKTIYKAP